MQGPDGAEIPAHDAMLRLACEHENVWLDLDDWQRRDAEGLDTYVDFLHRALAGPARQKVMFGSDYPVYTRMYAEEDWIAAILRHAEQTGWHFPEEDLDLFFSANALRFLGLVAPLRESGTAAVFGARMRPTVRADGPRSGPAWPPHKGPAPGLRASGLHSMGIRYLRHTSATLLRASPANPRVVADRLGHSNVAIALARYARVPESMEADAAAGIARALDG